MLNCIMIEADEQEFEGSENVVNITIRDINKDGNHVMDVVPVPTNDPIKRCVLVKYVTKDEIEQLKRMRMQSNPLLQGIVAPNKPLGL